MIEKIYDHTKYDMAIDLKKDVYDYVKAMLGGGMVEVELDPIHYEVALGKAISKYRQLSSNSMEESYGFLDLQPNQNLYVLDPLIMNVRAIYRRSWGGMASGQGSTNFDPFSSAYSNLYLLQGGRIGGLATYDMFVQYTKLVGRMFGGNIVFTYDSQTKKLVINRNIHALENVLLWLDNYRPDETILQDIYASPWIKDYSLGIAKIMIGEAREKFGSTPGPQGGTTLNGTALKAEGQALIERMEDELHKYAEGSKPLTFVIG